MLLSLLNVLQPLCLVAFLVDVLLLFVSLVPRARHFTGAAILHSSWLFGATTWFLGLLITWQLWGGFAAMLGVFLFGVGPVIMALLALMFNGLWAEVPNLLIWSILTWGVRIVGVAIIPSDDPAAESLAN